MKKQIILIYCIALEILDLSANSISGIYYLDINSDITCFIDLYPDNQYDLSLYVSHTIDINKEIIISSGKYEKTSKIIILTDTIHGFTIRLQQNANKSITVKKGFVFLKDKVFHYRTTSAKTNYDLPFYKIKNQKQERSTYKQLHKQLYPLSIGKYEEENNTVEDKEYNIYQTGLGYELDIKKEHSYIIYYKQLLLLEGQWKRNGNEIALFDSYLQHPFYVLLGKDCLISCYLPGDFHGMVLHRKNSGQTLSNPIVPESRPMLGFDIGENIHPEEPFMFVEEMPRFPHGEKAMLRFIKENTRTIKSATETTIKGQVIVRFVVDKDGSISNIRVEKKLSPDCDKEAIRVVQSMPKWVPGRHKGVNVAVKYIISIDFGME